jgi:dipeptide/tripeptide permease
VPGIEGLLMDNELENGGITPGGSPAAKTAGPDESPLKAKPGVTAPDVSKTTSTRHPAAIWFFFWGEFAERSSYYGMRAILFLYLTMALRFSDTEATPLYSAFKMGCYLLPLLGGLLADQWFGRYWTIVGFSVPYVAGHFILGYSDPLILGGAIQGMSPARLQFVSNMLLFVALALLAGGSGVIKPNISSLLGQTYDQKRPGQERLRSSAFLWFYLAINIGALISQLALPEIRERYIMGNLDADSQAKAVKLLEEGRGEEIAQLASPEVVGRAYQIAFAFPTVLMALSLIVFAAGKRTYAVEKRDQALTPEERRQRFESLMFILGIYGLFVLYFMFDQFLLRWLPEGPSWLFTVEDGQRHWTMAARATAIGITFVAVVALVARSVMAAGRQTFAVEKHDDRGLTPEEQRQRRKALGYLLAIFGLVILFWFGYEHNDTLWVAFIRDYVSLKTPFREKPFAPDQLQFLNALFVIILVPVFNGAFKYLDPDVKVFTSMRKIFAGFVLTAAGIAIMSAAGYLVQDQAAQVAVGGKMRDADKVSFLWPAMAYIVLTFGEVLLYGTMLDLSYAAAPKSMKGYVTACFLLTNTLANFLNILWTPLYGGSLPDPVSKRGPLAPGAFFGVTAAITLAAALLFVYIGRRFERIQEEEKETEAAMKALAATAMGPAPRGPSGDGITDRDRIQ